MLIISNHVSKYMDYPKGAVIRLNLAWLSSKETAATTLKGLSKEVVYLDYPQGRSKPPKPIITLNEAIELANKFKNVKYFAVSNVETSLTLLGIQSLLREGVEVVPKIETKKGVAHLKEIITRTKVKYIMLDAEDLWTDVERDNDEFIRLKELTRTRAEANGAEVLELRGVVFA